VLFVKPTEEEEAQLFDAWRHAEARYCDHFYLSCSAFRIPLPIVGVVGYEDERVDERHALTPSRLAGEIGLGWISDVSRYVVPNMESNASVLAMEPAAFLVPYEALVVAVRTGDGVRYIMSVPAEKGPRYVYPAPHSAVYATTAFLRARIDGQVREFGVVSNEWAVVPADQQAAALVLPEARDFAAMVMVRRDDEGGRAIVGYFVPLILWDYLIEAANDPHYIVRDRGPAYVAPPPAPPGSPEDSAPAKGGPKAQAMPSDDNAFKIVAGFVALLIAAGALIDAILYEVGSLWREGGPWPPVIDTVVVALIGLFVGLVSWPNRGGAGEDGMGPLRHGPVGIGGIPLAVPLALSAMMVALS
jgi:hypothetical protein